MKQYGCIGKKLTHSFSKEIHARLADYDYNLIELKEEEVAHFFAQKAFAAVNVTIPYKETVIPFLDEVSEIAQRIGAVNTVVNRDGRLYGYNTDYYGMKALVRRIELDLKGKKVLILGTGGTSKTARVVASDLGAKEILIVSRSAAESAITYEEAATKHSDAQIIINTTPSGMYPDVDAKPIDITSFPKLEGVVDAVYNPLCTNLVLDAKERGIKAEGGLYMLVIQAVAAVEKFLDTTIEQSLAEKVFSEILAKKQNVVLTGMPGSGKSSVGRCLSLAGFVFADSDEEVQKRCGCSIKDLIAERGEAYFRDLEAAVVADLAKEGGRIIATGGGVVLRPENVRHLKQNGKLYFLDAPLQRLQATDDRPLSDTKEKLARLYEARIGIYEKTADLIIPDLGSAQKEAEEILKKRMECVK